MRTLRLIGTEQALETLEAYGSDVRGTVVKELLAAWPFFDRREYARRVLSQSKGLWGGLRIENLDGLEGLGYLSSLQKLTVNSYRREFEEGHLAEIRQLVQLNQINIRATGSFDISSIDTLKKLHSLRLEVSSVINLDALTKLPSISELDLFFVKASDIGYCELLNANRINVNGSVRAPEAAIKVSKKLSTFLAPNIGLDFSVDFLKSAPRLTRLALPFPNLRDSSKYITSWDIMTGLFMFSASDVSSLSVIPDCQNLQVLALYSPGNLANLSGLGRFSKLTDLQVSGAKALTDISGIEECPNLRQITIGSESPDIDLSPLRNVPSLNQVSAPPALLRRIRALGLSVNHRAVPMVQ